jgi:hypothetical protein
VLGRPHLTFLSIVLFAFAPLCVAQPDRHGADLDLTDFRPTFSQEFKKLPPLHAGGVKLNASKPLDDPSFIWTAARKSTRPSTSAIPGRTYRYPTIAWLPGESAVYPNQERI